MLRDVWRYPGQFEIGAVDHGAFTATFLWTHQILETLATQTAAIVLLTCGEGQEREINRCRGRCEATAALRLYERLSEQTDGNTPTAGVNRLRQAGGRREERLH